jgi:methylmalonyl-CoA mutase cobalamin-binding subunit
MFRYTVPLLILALFVIACAERVDYIGNSYAPTTNVELFFSEDDIKEEYVEMGRAIAHAGTNVSSEELLEDLREKARERGADAILVHNFGLVEVGDTTRWDENQSSTRVVEERQIEATFIKYKKNL